MHKRWIWAPLVALPLAVGGFVFGGMQAGVDEQAGPQKAGYTCPVTGEELPCPKCCPLNE